MKEDFLDTVRRLGHGLVDSAQNRLKLLQSELATELDRLGILLAYQILVALLALLTVQLMALVVLAITWDTPWRIHAMAALTLIAAGGTVAAYYAYTARKARKEPIFAASIDELDRDRLALEKIS